MIFDFFILVYRMHGTKVLFSLGPIYPISGNLIWSDICVFGLVVFRLNFFQLMGDCDFNHEYVYAVMVLSLFVLYLSNDRNLSCIDFKKNVE